MTDQNPEESHMDLVLKLDGQRRQEIDSVKDRMDEFLRGQIEITHKVDMIGKGQEVLKERFEIGTARTLKELKDSFDQFRIEWGKKLSDDENRDKVIKTVEIKVDKVEDRFNKYILWPVITFCIMVLFAGFSFFMRGGR